MKIMIDIPNKLYEYIVKGKDLSEEQNDEMALAIVDGILLPKHRGRLIDADDLMQKLVDEGWITGYYGGGLEDIVNEAPTIIEKE